MQRRNTVLLQLYTETHLRNILSQKPGLMQRTFFVYHSHNDCDARNICYASNTAHHSEALVVGTSSEPDEAHHQGSNPQSFSAS